MKKNFLIFKYLLQKYKYININIFYFIYLFIYLIILNLAKCNLAKCHIFNTPHTFKKIGETQPGEMQFGEMPHTHLI